MVSNPVVRYSIVISMSISSGVRRKLWAASGGYCGNPACHKDLFTLSETGKILNIEELAHIIGQSQDGPRGEEDLPLDERDKFENIILLCPTCHTLIDKNPELYPVEVVREWKKKHEESVRSLFETPKFASRQELRKYIEPFLIENKTVFETLGPESSNAIEHQLSAEQEWARQCIHTIIPNNRRIENAIANNMDFLSPEEMELFVLFKRHREGFEYNHVSGDVSELVPTFPEGFEIICV